MQLYKYLLINREMLLHCVVHTLYVHGIQTELLVDLGHHGGQAERVYSPPAPGNRLRDVLLQPGVVLLGIREYKLGCQQL